MVVDGEAGTCGEEWQGGEGEEGHEQHRGPCQIDEVTKGQAITRHVHQDLTRQA
jgi:hypothetical protein